MPIRRDIPVIGLTTRGRSSPNGDLMDTISREWAEFLALAAPDVVWVPVPNIGGPAAALAERLDLSGLVLTGGEDPGVEAARDRTESALLEWALRRGRPVLGVCRGLQFLQTYFGGELGHCEGHVAIRHPAMLVGDGPRVLTADPEVNSYHARCVWADELAPALEALALAEVKGTDRRIVEALRLRHHDVLAVQWHPERTPTRAGMVLLHAALHLDAE